MKQNLIIAVLLVFLSTGIVCAGDIKDPNVAGTFYPTDAKELSTMIDGYITHADVLPRETPVTIAIAPHAGYIYSGPVAGYAFKALSKQKYQTIIVLAPSHYYPFDGAAIWSKGGFQTPLGVVPVDQEFTSALMKKTSIVADLPDMFKKEHALEVELPFIQKVFPHAKIVPIILGQPDFNKMEHVATAINDLIGDRKDILVLVSSDMSHYLPYDKNNERDTKTLQALSAENVQSFWNGNLTQEMEMCGFVPVTVGLMIAKLKGLTNVEILRHANSGDTSGDKSKVVGYAAILFTKDEGLNAAEKNTLLETARRSLDQFVKTGKSITVDKKDNRLNKIQGAFVTLTKNGELRGCIGNIIGQQPLIETVKNMAVAAASQDPRFQPVTVGELNQIKVEVSVLSVPQQVKNTNDIVLGRDGVIISDGGDHQGVFLPQVATETGWTKEIFLSELCTQKANLDAKCYEKPSTQLFTFTAEVFHER